MMQPAFVAGSFGQAPGQLLPVELYAPSHLLRLGPRASQTSLEPVHFTQQGRRAEDRARQKDAGTSAADEEESLAKAALHLAFAPLFMRQQTA
eukprot:Skav235627  [mRNA]  locus=scaffold358:318983:322990:+ [translate_table: standard]